MNDAVRQYAEQARAEAEQAAEDDLVRRHLWLPFLYIRRRDGALPIDEQLAVANCALVEAARSWPTSKAKEKGFSFSWYAGNVILAALHEARRQALVVYVSRRESQRLRRLRTALDQDPGRTDAELAEALGWTVEEVQALRQRLDVLVGPISLTRPAFADEEEGPDRPTEAEALPDPSADVEGEALARIERGTARRWLQQRFERLSPKARMALSLRFGIPAGNEALALDDVLACAVQLESLTAYGLRQLREEAGNGAELGAGRRRAPVELGRARTAAAGASRRGGAEDLWDRLARGAWLPPALSDASLGAGALRVGE